MLKPHRLRIDCITDQATFWGNHFWAKGYGVDTIGLDPEMIRKYVRYQEGQERQEEQRSFNFYQIPWG